MFHTDEWEWKDQRKNKKSSLSLEEQWWWEMEHLSATMLSHTQNGESGQIVKKDLNYCSVGQTSNFKFNVGVKQQPLADKSKVKSRLLRCSQKVLLDYFTRLKCLPRVGVRTQRYLLWLSLGFLPPWTWSWCWPGLCRCRCKWCSHLDLLPSFQGPQRKTGSWGPEGK